MGQAVAGPAWPIAEKLRQGDALSAAELELLVRHRTPELAEYLAKAARAACEAVYGDALFARGLIEISNICRNDCYYCGIRRSNRSVGRYRLAPEDVLACAEEGWQAGFRTFVLQGGEDAALTDAWLCAVVGALKAAHPGCAVTLSVGERSPESYRCLRAAGADRYLLRHETATAAHYRQLHPRPLTLEARLACLQALREAGFAVGAGFMVGSPGQTATHLAADLAFLQRFRPEMCGIGPFVPHHATPFAAQPAGSVELTCYLLSIIRLMNPAVLLPATTALEALDPEGRRRAVRAGANVVMPNLSPPAVQGSYQLYDNKPAGGEAAQRLWDALAQKARSWGKRLVEDRGDPAAVPVGAAALVGAPVLAAALAPAGVPVPASIAASAAAPARPSSPDPISPYPKEA